MAIDQRLRLATTTKTAIARMARLLAMCLVNAAVGELQLHLKSVDEGVVKVAHQPGKN